MEKWMIIFQNDADRPGTVREDDGEAVAVFNSFDEAQKAWDAMPLSKIWSAWAFDYVNGDVEAL